MDQESFYKRMLENFFEGVYFVDRDRQITFWNKGAERITGFPGREVIGKYCYDNILNHVDEAGTQLCLQGCPLERTIGDGQIRESGVYLHHKGGHRVKIFVRTTPIYEGEEIIGAVESFIDDTERATLAASLEELKELAMYDQLTGLPNRRYVNTYLDSRFNEYRSLGIPFAIAFIDIDYFKRFNDTYGHELGDRVLKMVSETYRSAVRNGDLVGRWGGEEFIAAFPGITPPGLQAVTEKIRMLVENSSLRDQDEDLKVTVSIGASLVRPGDTMETLVNRADQLMYASKEGGRNRVTTG